MEVSSDMLDNIMKQLENLNKRVEELEEYDREIKPEIIEQMKKREKDTSAWMGTSKSDELFEELEAKFR